MEYSPKALHVTYRGPRVTSTRTYLYSLVTPTNTKQNMPLYYTVSLADWLSLLLSGSFSKLIVLGSNPNKEIKIFKAGK